MEQFDVLIIGGGAAGAACALAAAENGRRVALAEREPVLGGQVAGYGCKAGAACNKCHACLSHKKFQAIPEQPGITVLLGAQLRRLAGTAGAYQALLATPDGERTLAVRSLVAATGFTPFDARQKSRFGYGRYPNVISGSDAEQQFRQYDTLRRISDNRPPEQVAFIQCVGSRDQQTGNTYCSRVCCAYALRMADRFTHVSPAARATIFYMDIQSFGKDFEVFYRQCQANPRLRFIRTIPGAVRQTSDQRLRLVYETAQEGAMTSEEYDLVVLSVGITANPANRGLAEVLGLQLDEYGFFKSVSTQEPLQTHQPGVFIAGTCRAPMPAGQALAEGEAVARYV